MTIQDLTSGKYIVAISGGVDSMVLLDLLRKQRHISLIVAHFDHGIRKDSRLDRILVENVAKSYGLSFVTEKGNLDAETSEAEARRVRYDFLRRVYEKENGYALITAHHQDDVLETAIINLLRGTGRKGLTSLDTHERVVRPLLHVSKQEIISYAQQNNIEWREDSTNTQQKYLRNYVRHTLFPLFSEAQRSRLLEIIDTQRNINQAIQKELAHYQGMPSEFSRYEFIMLPDSVAFELLQAKLRTVTGKSLQRPTLERILHFIRTAKSSKRFLVSKGVQLKACQREVIVESSSVMLS